MLQSHDYHMCYRWVNVLDGKVKKGEWTREEDEKLLQLCQEYQDNGEHYIEPCCYNVLCPY